MKRRGRPPLGLDKAKSERITIALRVDQALALKAWVASRPHVRRLTPLTPSEAARQALIEFMGLPR